MGRPWECVDGLVIGVGAALAISGAVTGTIGPQVQDTVASLNPTAYPDSGWLGVLNTAIIAVGTIGTLLYFQFSMRKSKEGEEKSRGRLVEFGGQRGPLGDHDFVRSHLCQSGYVESLSVHR